jgi:hypothetical protein
MDMGNTPKDMGLRKPLLNHLLKIFLKEKKVVRS